MEILDIVNENDEVVGTASRKEVHKKGLRHRQVHIMVYNDNQDILCHMRHRNKDNYPGLIDIAAGGHVETGMSYLETALKELGEEYDIKLEENDLIEVRKYYRSHIDKITNSRFKLFDTVYLCKYNGRIENLNYQKEEIEFLEWWSSDKLFNTELLTEEEKQKFVPMVSNGEIEDVLKEIKKMILNIKN